MLGFSFRGTLCHFIMNPTTMKMKFNTTDDYVERVRKMWDSKKPLYTPFSGELVDQYGNENPLYFEQFEKDLEYINSLDSYKFIEWLEQASPSSIDNYRNYVDYKNQKENWLKKFCNFIDKLIEI